MNYWLLTTEYPPFHGGGISTYCLFTARMLSEAGHTVTVFVQDDSFPDYSDSNSNPQTSSDSLSHIRLIRFNSNRNKLHASLGYEARLSYGFADMVRIISEREGKPDFIEAQDYLGIAYYLTQFKHAGYSFVENVPIIITLHSPAFIYLEYNRVSTYRFPEFWTCEMEKQSIIAADFLISPTWFLIDEIQKFMNIKTRPQQVLANPFRAPVDKTTGKMQEMPPAVQRGKIVYYGKLSPQKGSFELLSYFKNLWDEGFTYPLHIVGGTDIVYHPEMQTMGQLVLKQYAPYLTNGLLQLHGKIQPSEIKNYLNDAHVILVPSIVDNLPYVVMEAMSLGKIVLASIQGGQREMMEDGISGFLFDHRQPDSFKVQLEKILALTDTEIQRIGVRAMEQVRRAYSFETILLQKMDILRQLTVKPSQNDHFPFHYQEDNKVLTLVHATNDLLSIVIPYYNMGEFIEECIRSVQQSTYAEKEIIVINDGSTDPDSIKKLESLARWKGVQVVHHKNQGLALTRNYGASMARGKWLAFLDADDKVSPEYYSKAIHALKRNGNVFFVGSWVQYFGNSDQLWTGFTPQPPYILVHNSLNSSGLVYKRAAFLAGGLNDKTTDYGLEDYESVVNLISGGWNGIVLPEPLFHYRVRKGSMFRQVTRSKLLYSNKYIQQKHRVYYTKFASQIINILNANGPCYLFDNPTFEVTVSVRTSSESKILILAKSLIKRNERLKKIALIIKKIKR